MSNTIRRPRKRPRVRSCSFRTLGWLIRREAAYRIYRKCYVATPRAKLREWVCSVETTQLQRGVLVLLREDPTRRYYP